MSASRDHGLDGIRGLAALAVALGHCNLAISGLPVWNSSLRDFSQLGPEQIALRALYVIFPSDAAVTLFFVLSGYVLWQSFQRRGTGFAQAPAYVIARAYRLLPVAMVSALPLAFILNASATELAANMLLLSRSMNGVLWSLQVEAVCSLAIFIVWLACGRSPWRLLILTMVAAALVPPLRDTYSVLFFPAFLLGAGIGAVPDALWRSRGLFFLGLAVLLLASLVLGHSLYSRAAEMAGAMIVVGCTRARPLSLLTRPSVQFLGAISYPFYLCHTTGLLLAERSGVTALTSNAFGQIGLLIALSLPIAIVLASLIHVLVERPTMRIRPTDLRLPHPFEGRWRASAQTSKHAALPAGQGALTFQATAMTPAESRITGDR